MRTLSIVVLALLVLAMPANAAVVIDMPPPPAPEAEGETTYEGYRNGKARTARVGQLALSRYGRVRHAASWRYRYGGGRRSVATGGSGNAGYAWAATGYPHSVGYAGPRIHRGCGSFGFAFGFAHHHHHRRHHVHRPHRFGHHNSVRPAFGSPKVRTLPPSSFRFKPGR